MCLGSWAAISRLLFVLLVSLPLLGLSATSAAARSITILEATMAAAVSPAQADMLDAALSKAVSMKAQALLLRLDTPGGGVEVMRRMVGALLNAPVPVIVWVAPSGARAASAGVFLMAAAQVNAMAPQTSIGSASPVGPGGSDLTGTMNTKIRNDLESLLRGVVASRGRNVDWYLRSVSKAANLTATEAARDRVVDYIAVSREDLFTQIGKRGLPAGGGLLHFTPEEVTYETFIPGFWYDALSWILDPQIAYMLLLAGMAGLFFELTTPGAVLPGVIGGISLLLALYALSVLPTNVAGLLLLILGAVFFGLEIHVTSYGLLSLAGVLSLFFGSLLLFRFEGRPGLALSFILPTVAGLSLLLGLGAWILAKAQRLKPQSGMTTLVGQTATVRHWSGLSGKVFVHGELWNAVSQQAEPFSAGQEVLVTQAVGMQLVVTKITGKTAN